MRELVIGLLNARGCCENMIEFEESQLIEEKALGVPVDLANEFCRDAVADDGRDANQVFDRGT